MSRGTALRMAVTDGGVSIWSAELFGHEQPTRARDFLARAFAVPEVELVELRRASAFGRIRYAAASPSSVLKKLGLVLRSTANGSQGSEAEPIDVTHVHLDGPSPAPIHVSRIGGVLSTWRARRQEPGSLRLWHPFLRNRRDVAFRLEEELGSIQGIREFRVSALSAGVSIRFDESRTTVGHLIRELELAWPRLCEGLEGPPSGKRLVVAAGLTALAYTGQYVAPAVRPFALAGVALYALPNVANAAKQLTRGEVGLYALYTTGLAFMLYTGMPLTASVMATLMQLWPQLGHGKLVRIQRRVFVRQRPALARLQHAGGEREVYADELRSGDSIVVRRGEVIPADGVVTGGAAAIFAAPPLGGNHIEDRVVGDAVLAGASVYDGSLVLRVERAGARTSARHIASLLPRGALLGLPSSLEAERIANRNARPALALSAITLLATRTVLPGQAVLRPDYATAPRLSAQLSALQAIARGSRRGILFKNLAALDRLARADVFVIDDTAGLERRQIEARVRALNGGSPESVLSLALAALDAAQGERGRALAALAAQRQVVAPGAEGVERAAGVTRYRDRAGSTIELATAGYLAALQIKVPPALPDGPVPSEVALLRAEPPPREQEAALLRPLWVLREREVVGVVSFARTGVSVGRRVVAALREQRRRARILYLSRSGQPEVQAFADALGIEYSRGELARDRQAAFIRELGPGTVWVGDGADVEAREPIAASGLSISVAQLSRAPDDAADVLLPLHGLASLPELLQLGDAHAQRLARDYRSVYTANLLGLAGAFGAGLNGLQVGLLSNLGTAVVYSRHAMALDSLASSIEAERARLSTAPR